MILLLVILLVLLLFGGTGYFATTPYPGYGYSLLTIVVLILFVLFLTGNLHIPSRY